MADVRKEAFTILWKVFKKNLFSDKLLDQSAKRLSSEDQDLLYPLVKGIIKLRKNLDFTASHFTDKSRYEKSDLKIKILLYMGFYQLIHMDSIPDHAALNETVELTKKMMNPKAANFVNAVLRNYQRNPELTYPTSVVERISAMYSYPEELVKTWIEYWGEEDTEYLCMYFNEAPQLHLRANLLETNAEKLLRYFAKRNVETHLSMASPVMLYTDNARAVLRDIAFSEGYFSIQDTSAALVVDLMTPKPGESILDMFAAPGGKASYIGERLQGEGEIIAIDKFPAKVKLIKHAVERLQIRNMKLINQDAFHYGPVAPAFDRVLLDVPCSGWGVLRKKAELRWQVNQDIPELKKIQFKALENGAKFVKPEGYLIYSTCTLNKEENEYQVEKFLEKHTNFKCVDARNFIPKEYCDGKYLKTIPFRHNMDGSFGAKLKRID
jgi:16S rRNA (cytosine967-C5)-methyltransferase